MKKLFLLAWVTMFSCLRVCSQQDAGGLSGDPIFDAELNNPGSDPMATPLLPGTVDTKTGYFLVQQRINHRSSVLTGMGPQNDTFFSITTIKHKLKGIWLSRYPGHQLIDSGRLEKSIPDGVWKTWYPDGGLRTVRTYSASKLSALKNELRRYNYKLNMNPLVSVIRSRPQLLSWVTSAGNSYRNLNGFQVPVAGQGNSLLLRSVANVIRPSGYVPPFDECLHDGLYINFFASGELKDSGYYKNGLRDGVWIEKSGDARFVSRGAYFGGYRDGNWSSYAGGKKLVLLESYKKGVRVSSKRY